MIRKKINFKRKSYFKTIIFKLSITALIFLSFTIILVSCTSRPSSKSAADDESTSEITSEELEEAVKALEESNEEVVDYENVSVGAEIKGSIPNYLCTDKDNYIKIEITNTSDFTWKKDGKNIVRFGYHYYGQDVEYTEYDKTARTALAQDLKPGETATIEILINDITNKGTYAIQIDPVLEGHFWFSAKGVPMLEGTAYFGSCSD